MEPQTILNRLLTACDRISHSWNVEEGLSAVVHSVFTVLKPQSVAIALADERSGEYRIAAWRGLSAAFVNHHRINADSAIVRQLTVAGESVAVTEFGAAADDPAAPLRLETSAGSLLASPIEAMNRPVGMIIATSDQTGYFTDEQLLLVRIAARLAGACHDRCSLYAERQHLSCIDHRSGLWSFEFFCRRMSEEIARSRRAGKFVSLLLIDIDNFIPFHQIHGQEAADELIVRFVDLVRSTIRGIDFAGRFGLNNLLVALPETNLHGARIAAQRVLDVLREQPVGPDKQVITASIGISQLAASEEDGMAAMLERAQKALYLAQFHGSNRVEVAES